MSKGPTIGDWTQYEWIPDDASSFPARIRLRNAAWMVYYEPDAVVQRERAERLELRDENAKLRELLSSYWKRTHSPVSPNVERDYLLEMRELGIEVPDV